MPDSAGVPVQHWHVLGAGAIGTLLAFQLQRGGCEVTLLRRDAADCARQPVLLDARGREVGRFRQQTLGACRDIGYLLVCTKAFDLHRALAGCHAQLAPRARVIITANGLGFEQELARLLGDIAPLRAVCTEGAFRDPQAPDCIVHAGSGETRVGQVAARGAADVATPAWFREGPQRLAHWRWDARIERALWHKFTVNCAINALTAVHRCPNGALLANAALKAELAALCLEIEQASLALGQVEAQGALWARVCRVINATANNRSSMLQDVEQGRRTEIDYLNGYLLRQADTAGIAVPKNRALVAQLATVPRPT